MNQTIRTVVLCLGCFVATGIPQASAVELESLSSNVFKFQQKLANNGNVQSQTKLGEMLETGNGVNQDLEQAKHWYQKAASNGYEPALNRLTYLEVKTTGYDNVKHAAWMTEIKKQSEQQNRDSMLLLAQMYREGISVEKNLPAAKQLLEILSVSGNMSIDKENALLDAEIIASEKREQQLTSQRANQASQRAEAARLQKVQQADKAQQAAVEEKAAAASAEETTEEKKKRYEAVMRKLQEEQKILKEQQSWAEDRGN